MNLNLPISKSRLVSIGFADGDHCSLLLNPIFLTHRYSNSFLFSPFPFQLPLGPARIKNQEASPFLLTNPNPTSTSSLSTSPPPPPLNRCSSSTLLCSSTLLRRRRLRRTLLRSRHRFCRRRSSERRWRRCNRRRCGSSRSRRRSCRRRLQSTSKVPKNNRTRADVSWNTDGRHFAGDSWFAAFWGIGLLVLLFPWYGVLSIPFL